MSAVRFVFCVVCVLVMAAVPALARQVEVFVPGPGSSAVQAGEGTVATASADDPLQAAFEQAVYEEALTIVPGELADPRKRMLREVLAPRVSEYVLSYATLSSTAAPDGTLRTYRVGVDRNRLERTLRRLGVYHTVYTLVPFSLQVQGGLSPASAAELSSMQRLSGLTPQGQAPLVLAVGHDADTGWQLRLQGVQGASDAPLTGSGEELAEVWEQVFGPYFARESRKADRQRYFTLRVQGWVAPDGVQAFGQDLVARTDVVGDAELVAVSLGSESIGASWRVRTRDLSQLVAAVNQMTVGRGLDYSFVQDGMSGAKGQGN